MRKIIFIALVLFTACKKKKVTVVEPEPTPVVCQTGNVLFAGKYIKETGGDTLYISFKRNLCPVENSNEYNVRGLDKILNPYISSGNKLFKDTIYILSSNEIAGGYLSANGKYEGLVAVVKRNPYSFAPGYFITVSGSGLTGVNYFSATYFK